MKQVRIAAKPVDDEPFNPILIGCAHHRLRSDDLRDDPAAIYVADKNDGNVRRCGEAHVGDVPLAQVDLGGAARAFHDHEVAAGAETTEALQDTREKFGLQTVVFPRFHGGHSPPLHDDLGAGIRLRLQQDRVHVGVRRQPAGQRLQGLGAADLSPVRGDGRVVGHVLRLEGRNGDAPAPRSAAQAGDEQRLADV